MSLDLKTRLEELRAVLRAENMSYGELAELQDYGERGLIPEDDLELREAAGLPEFPDYEFTLPVADWVKFTYNLGDTGPIIDNLDNFGKNHGRLRVTTVVVTEYTNDEPSEVRVEGRRVTKDGSYDRRHSYATLVFSSEVDDAYLDAHASMRHKAVWV